MCRARRLQLCPACVQAPLPAVARRIESLPPAPHPAPSTGQSSRPTRRRHIKTRFFHRDMVAFSPSVPTPKQEVRRERLRPTNMLFDSYLHLTCRHTEWGSSVNPLCPCCCHPRADICTAFSFSSLEPPSLPLFLFSAWSGSRWFEETEHPNIATTCSTNLDDRQPSSCLTNHSKTPEMSSPSRRAPPSLKRSYSGESHSSYASAATTSSRSSSKLLFGEIPLSPATTIDGRSTRSNSSICNLVLSTSSAFLRFWLNDACRDNLLAHVETEDLPDLRLVCHDFSARAAPFLFESMTVTFKPSSFSKPARVEALKRIGRHVKTFTFHMPHSQDTLLPPIIDPETGAEKQFLYEPQLQVPQHVIGQEKTPKYGTWKMTNLLIAQYPPLFHAATNVPAFVSAFSELINLTHLKISCPGYDIAPRHRRTVVDYALISLRIAVERAPMYSLSSLSLHPIHPGGLLYLHPMHGFGSTPSSAKRWSQIRNLSICMESLPIATTQKANMQSLEHLRILHAYLRTLSRGITRLFFRWKGARGPSPLSLDKEPCMLPVEEECMHPSMRGQVRGPRPLRFSRMRHMELENAVMDSAQIADFIHKHRRSLVEFNFEDVKLREGNWDEALEPLTLMAGNDRWRRTQEEVMDVPIVLSPVGMEPMIMGPLLEEVDQAIEYISREDRATMNSHSLSKWLAKPKTTLKKSPHVNKDSFWGGGGDHVKRLLKFSSWK
ncbi:unnamed protein product [Periconia digitata]|uniref:Uncharacterized protein n=1 Tax=Periconia digitata TaxID=1303443 RepID=A0A9W4XVJ8_9PLEO|nr:unnamed protein product [Periconia digitata]